MTGSDWWTLFVTFLVACLLWRFFKALAWQPPAEAYKREFSRVRRDVLDRDGHRCQRCGRYMASGMHVHHLHQRQYGGSNAMSNLISLCPQCHQLIHGRKF